MRPDRRSRGFTLIELLIVVAIIGILAAIAIPNLLNAMHRAKQKRSMADMRTIASGWEARAIDMHSYSPAGVQISWPDPTSDVGLLAASLTPTYISKIPHYDGWSNSFRVGTTSRGDSYALASYGADRTKSITETTAAGAITTSNFDCDIIFSEGAFVVYPEGVQTQ